MADASIAYLILLFLLFIYAVEADFSGYSLTKPETHERIERVASEVLLHLPRTAASRKAEAKADAVWP